MRLRNYLILGLSIAGSIGGIYLSRGSNDVGDLERLQRHEELRERQKQEAWINEREDELSKLARLGQGAPVPSYLDVQQSKTGAWIVRKPNATFAAVLPFPPGQLPQPPSKAEPLHENPGFLGASACQDCHEETFASFSKTSHHLTSHLATPGSIRGSLENDESKLFTSQQNVSFKMLERDDVAWQRAQFLGWEFEVPMHIVTGSSKSAQTFLYWNDDELYQCNVTYLTQTDSWINSPGYHDGDAAYERPIMARCLECHTTYIDYREPINHFTPSTLITGISCERCHGPGRDHVEYHRANPSVKKSNYVTVPSDLSREQELDVCSQCHSSITPLKGRPFEFRPGDDLSQHYEPATQTSGNSVHTSNQIDRLARSECFQQTEMTCVDCHNPHRLERGDIAMFSQRCISCHEVQVCGMSEELGAAISANCIDCHMPIGESDQLRLDTATDSIFPAMRDHFIRIDREASDAFLGQNAVVR